MDLLIFDLDGTLIDSRLDLAQAVNATRLHMGMPPLENAQVCSYVGNGAAVLLRAVEPVINLAGKTNGPGLLCRALEIDRRLNGRDLLSDDFFIAMPEVAEKISLTKRPRIGVDYARHWAKRLLRFYIRDNPFVSRR